MKVKITKIDGDKITFLEGKEEKTFFKEAHVLDGFVKLGEAEITIQNGKITFCTMGSDSPIKPASNEEVKSENKKNAFGQFRPNEVVIIKGKNHVIYEGLLRLAHEKGLRNFEILEKFVSEDMKKSWCLVRAHCEKIIGLEGKKQEVRNVYFDGIGSSTPENTGTMTESHPVEMAHTRAKGRALRDFLNIGQAMAEEIKQ